MLGNSQRNKWCCFCKHWFDPACMALTPKSGRDMYEVDTNKKNKCNKKNLITPAISVCKDFTNKF